MISSYLLPTKLFSFLLLLTGIVTLSTILTVKKQSSWGVTVQVTDVLESPSGNFQIEALDLVSEPGEISSDTELKRFYLRQEAIEKITQERPLYLTSGGTRKELVDNEMPVSAISHLFWIQVIVGFGAMIITAWIWSLRPRRLATTLFLLSGVSTLCFTYSAAVYSTRELFLPVDLFKFLVKLNVLGASLFGVFILGLFFVYPYPFRNSKKLIIGEAVFFSTWMILSILEMIPAWAGVNLITLTEMVFILFAIIAQIIATRGLPIERASLTWLGLSIILGAGGFIILNAVPLFVGLEIPLAQGYAFLSFLLLYLGLGAGIGKYRLFEVGSWAYRFLFYFVGAALLLLMDAGFLWLLDVERIPAMGISIFIIGFFYLPLRGVVLQKLNRNYLLSPNDLIKEAILVSMSTQSMEREKNWVQLISKAFDPLEINHSDTNATDVRLLENGSILQLPQRPGLPAYILRYRNGGKSLFTKESVGLMNEILNLLDHVDAGRENYEKGVKEERLRIAQDLHDDVGSKLLTGLHSQGDELRSIISSSIKDIRDIVRGITGESTSFATVVADLRIECMNRSDAAGLKLIWPLKTPTSDFKIDYRISKTLRSTTRELITNTIKHSDATTLEMQIFQEEKVIKIQYFENGTSFPKTEVSMTEGMGFKSMRKRVLDLGGSFEIMNTENGLKINLRIQV